METFKLQKIDESLLPEHICLELNDNCYFLGEYAGRQGYSYSEANQLIFNFKKPMNKKGQIDWDYKHKAIEDIAKRFLLIKNWPILKSYTWVPVPPSKTKSDTLYDDRLTQLLLEIKKTEKNLDVRELLIAKFSRDAAHDPNSLTRPEIFDHFNNWNLNFLLKNPTPLAIAIFDDVITTGASFKAAQTILQKEFPQIPTIGFFIARNIKL